MFFVTELGDLSQSGGTSVPCKAWALLCVNLHLSFLLVFKLLDLFPALFLSSESLSLESAFKCGNWEAAFGGQNEKFC